MTRTIALALVILVAVAAPWAFGARERYFSLALACAVLPGVLLAGVDASLRARPTTASLRRLEVCTLLAALLPGLWLVPLGPSSVVALSGAWEAIGNVAFDESAGPTRLSLVPEATWWAWGLAFAYAGGAWVVLHAVRGSARLRAVTTWSLICLGGVLACFGIAQRLIDYSPTRIYWSVELYEVGTPFGPYVNRNHFGGLMVLLAGVTVGELLSARLRDKPFAVAAAGVVLLVQLVALLATTSRGALLGATVSVAVLLALSGAWRRRGAWLAVAGVAAIAVAGAVVTGTFDELASRLFNVYGRWRNRFLVQEDALRLFARTPWVGIGPGTFAEGYQPFQTIDDPRYFSDAHSDWVQLLVETGLVGLLAGVALLSSAVSVLRRGLASAHVERPRIWGCAAGLAGLFVHGFFETNLRLPSNALLAAVTLSLACATAAAVADSELDSAPRLEVGA